MYGFYRVCSAVPQLRIADAEYNAAEIRSLYLEASENGAAAVIFPELSLSAATCGDIFYQNRLLECVQQQIRMLAGYTGDTVLIFGAPVAFNNSLYNCAVVAQNGFILGIVPKKTYGNDCFFADGNGVSGEIFIDGEEVMIDADMIFSDGKISFGVTVGEDLKNNVPQASFLSDGGAEIIFAMSAFAEVPGAWSKYKKAVEDFSARSCSAYIYASSGSGESVSDVVCAGHACIAENGEILSENRAFERDGSLIFDEIDVEKLQNLKLQKKKQPFFDEKILCVECDEIMEVDELRFRYIEPLVFVPEDVEELDEVIAIQTYALSDRIEKINAKTMVLGVSGGLDSTLALLICHNVCKKLNRPFSDIVAFTLPGFGTTGRTYSNAVALAKELGATLKEVNIKDAALQHFKDIGHDVNDIDVTYENTQARERTQILMDYANKSGGIVIGTGDLSELALGWCTYNGDHMSMYGVNCSVPKTQIRPLILRYGESCSDNIREVLQDIADTPVSPELLPPSDSGDIVQKTEDILGPYELHDFFLFHFVQFGASPDKLLFMAERAFKGVYKRAEIVRTLKMFMRRFFTQQFKRNAVPDGVMANCISLSPRGAWRMPSEASFASFEITEDK